MNDEFYMQKCIDLAYLGMGQVSPNPMVGCVIVHENEIIGEGHHQKYGEAHAEVNAIRAACKKIGAPNLKGAIMYTSCECCPMCYATAYWARIGKIYYAAAWTDYADLFDDSNIGQDLKNSNPNRAVPLTQLMQSDAQKVWAEYRKMPEKTKY